MWLQCECHKVHDPDVIVSVILKKCEGTTIYCIDRNGMYIKLWETFISLKYIEFRYLLTVSYFNIINYTF